MVSKMKIFLLGIFYTLCFVFIQATAQPTCPAYSISVGINTTSGTTLETITCTPSSGTVSYAIDTSSDGYVYFAVNAANGVLSLANRLDVEYGPVTWTVNVVATDGSGSTSAVVTVRTFVSTTTTTSTQPPPGYDWFDKSSNKYLFWSIMGVIAIIFGTCVMLCVRFHRIGTCLPKKCPQYGQMIDSFNRQVTCCPIPCDFYNKNKVIEDEPEEYEYVDDTPWGLPLREPKAVPITPKKASKEKKASTPKKATKEKKASVSKSNDKESTHSETDAERSVVITPLVIGNANLNDVGFDGMRSPGFNAPMFTTYGGKKDTLSRTVKKY